MRSFLCIALLASGCVTRGECQRRIGVAHRDALRDVATCRFAPDDLAAPLCSGLDRQPTLTYYSVFCATASADCIRDDEVVTQACLGRPPADTALTSEVP